MLFRSVRSPEGSYSEAHTPLPADEAFHLTQHDQPAVVTASPATDEHGVRSSGEGVSKFRAAISRWYYGRDIPKPTAAELESGHHGDDDGPEPPREITG